MKIKLTVALLTALLGMAAPVQAEDKLAEAFAKPPQEAKPWTFWWFQGGYGNPEGMARDIAAMKEMGIGGVLHMQTINVGGLPLPHQPRMLSPDWEAWFGEAVRLAHEAGMTMSASIVDGWGQGGWWVGKEDGAKQLVYSETQVDGPASLVDPLPQPLTRLGVYHDVAVVAFKEKGPRPCAPCEVKANNVRSTYLGIEENWPAAHAMDGDPQTCWRTQKPCATGAPAQLDVRYARPIRAVSALVAGMPKAGPAECELQVSEDGKAFRCVTRFTLEPGESKRVAFEPVTSRWFRLAVPRAHAPDLQLAEFAVLREGDEPVRPGIKWWDFKSANRGWWQWPPEPYSALEEEYTGEAPCDVSPADVLDLSARLKADGRLDWQAPAGRWTVLRFGWTPLAEPARMGSGGYEVDVLNARSADLMADAAAKLMRKLSVQKAGGAPIVFHTDSWEIGAGMKGQQPTWTTDFREQFRKWRGYDLLSYLPALARRIVTDRQTTGRFLSDYRATVADLLAAYYARLQERAHQMNGEINAESGYGSYPHPHMDGLQVFGRSDRPMAECWHPFDKYSAEFLQQVDVMRTAASAARIYGRRLVQAESLTSWSGVSLHSAPADYRRTLHEAWARGLNQAVIHKYTHQPFEEKPGMIDYDIFNRHITWWPMAEAFIGYMGRCQALLQEGDFVADAAYFVGEGATRFVPGKKFLKPDLPVGYDYDGINAEVLQTRAAVKDGRLVLPNGPRYRYLILCDPQCTTMNADMLNRIRQLVEQGLTLVGKRPLRTPGLSNIQAAEARLKTDGDVLWGAAPAAQGERTVGKGRVLWGRPVGERFAADGVMPDCQAVSPGHVGDKPVEITWLHRRSKDGHIYFLANPLNQPLDVTVALRSKGSRTQLFDPLDGSVRDLPEKTEAADGRTLVPLHFAPEQAFFVVIRDGKASPSGERNFPTLKPVLALEGPWQVSFDAAWVKPLPAGVSVTAGQITFPFERLGDWRTRPEDGIKGYSGMATYRKTFDLSGAAVAGPLILSVGEVKELARVTLNGKALGVSWCPPWRLRIPAGLLKAQGNELVIEVANLWNNRLLAEATLPEKDRITRIGKSYYALIQGDHYRSRPQSSGLLGPVRVLSVE